jgi:hypothetical protein
MSEQKPTITTAADANKPKYAWTIMPVNEDMPCKPPPLTRMSTGAIIDGVFTTKDEMMFKMKMESDKDKEKKD